MEQIIKERKEKLITECRKYIKSASKIDEINKAFKVAKEYHDGQLRKSGEPFLLHPIETAIILAGWKLPYYVIQSGLLHDVVEDTEATLEDLSQDFSPEVVEIVRTVTKISEVSNRNKRHADELYLKQIYYSLSIVPSASYVKVADRLHNMRTLSFLKPEKQKLISKETMDVYVPLANKIGMFKPRTELEDLAFKYLNPEEFEATEELRAKIISKTSADLKNLKREVYKKITSEGISVTTQYRIKTIYSIYKKLTRKGQTIDQIYDINAIRIVTENVHECYQALGIIHQNYIFVKGTFKDYISIRKKNLYSSLHTCINYNGHIIEIQIRTKEMDKVSNHGIAAYWKYKKETSGEEIHTNYIVEILKDKDLDNEKRLEELRNELIYSRMNILTKDGTSHNLRYSSNSLDLAFKVNAEKAIYLDRCLVNNRETNAFKSLSNGDVVELIYSSEPTINKNWTSLTQSKTTKILITQALNKISLNSANVPERWTDIKKRLGEISETLVSKLKWWSRINELGITKIELENLISKKKLTIDDLALLFSNSSTIYHKALIGIKKKVDNAIKSESLINIPFNQGSINISLSSCCTPVYGESIIGHVKNPYSIIVHRNSCEKFLSKGKKLVETTWNEKITKTKLRTNLSIKFESFPTSITEIVHKISNMMIPLLSIEMHNLSKKVETELKVSVEVRNIDQLNKLIRSIELSNGIISVKRI